MYKNSKVEQFAYSSPLTNVVDLMTESVLCMSFTDGNNGGNTGDDFEKGEDWGGLLS
jgi:hypothetical protein